jgi:hypothetical protein
VRDIRPDLHERLAGIESQRAVLRARYEAEVAALDAVETSVKALLAVENTRFPEPDESDVAPDEALVDFLLRAVQEAPRTKDELTRMAEEAGYARGGQSVGRVVHLTIVNMTKRQQLREAGGRYLRVSLAGKLLARISETATPSPEAAAE